jgi:hypothetical protein
MMKDILGREIKPGDFVVKSSSSYVQIRVYLVLKLNPKTVGLSSGAVASPEQVIVVTDQMVASNRQDMIDDLMKNYGSQIDTNPVKPKSSAKWRYLVFYHKDRVYVRKIAADTKQMLIKSKYDAFAAIDPKLEWHEIRQLSRLVYTPSSWRGPEKAEFIKSTYGSDLNDLGLSALRFVNITPDMVDRDFALDDFKSLTKNISFFSV